jgi:hypothetical protein
MTVLPGNYKHPYAQPEYTLQSALALQTDSALPHMVMDSSIVSWMHLMHSRLALTAPQPMRPHGTEQ